MDGCGYFQIFRHLLLPLSRPALTTVSIYIIAPVTIYLVFQRHFRQIGQGGLGSLSLK